MAHSFDHSSCLRVEIALHLPQIRPVIKLVNARGISLELTQDALEKIFAVREDILNFFKYPNDLLGQLELDNETKLYFIYLHEEKAIKIARKDFHISMREKSFVTLKNVYWCIKNVVFHLQQQDDKVKALLNKFLNLVDYWRI